MQKEHLWVGRSKGATPAGGRRAIKGAAHSNIRVAGWVGRSKAVTPAGGRRAILDATHSNISVAGVPQPDLGEAVVSSRYSNDNSSIFLSETTSPRFLILASICLANPHTCSINWCFNKMLHSHNHRRFSWWAGRLTGKPASDCQTKVAVVRGLLGDVDVLPMVVKEGGCGLKVRRQHPGREG